MKLRFPLGLTALLLLFLMAIYFSNIGFSVVFAYLFFLTLLGRVNFSATIGRGRLDWYVIVIAISYLASMNFFRGLTDQADGLALSVLSIIVIQHIGRRA